MRKRERIGYEDVVARCSKAKFDAGQIVDDVDNDVSLRHINRILLSLSKPCFVRRVCHGKLRHGVRCRLKYLLSKLVERHNWEEASGVLSILLKGTCKDNSPANNRMKYWVTMEILKHIESNRINPTRIRRIYETWMRRIGSMKKWPIEDRFAVQLEYILFCLTQGNVEEAHQAVICLMQQRDFGNNSILNLVVGLTFYQLWYFTIPKEMQMRDLDEPCDHLESEMSETRISNTVGNSVGYSAIDVLKEEFSSESESETSVRNDKVNFVSANAKSHRGHSEGLNDGIENEKAFFQRQDFYMNSAENTGHEESSFPYDDGDFKYFASIFSVHESWDPWLLPLRIPQTYENFDDLIQLHGDLINDYYKSAVKYLKLSVDSTPPMLAALLPFIQLLLLGGRGKEALNELEKFSQNSNAILPTRYFQQFKQHCLLRAGIMEHFDRDNYVVLSTCFEDIMKKDPTSAESLAKLITIHQNGDYDAGSLLEMIALHLDATYAELNTWREFALCFLKLSQCEEDRMSVCLDGNEGQNKPKYAVRFNRIPDIFIEGKSGKAWRFRCRWWLNRHFSENIIKSEAAAGKLELLAYKAACASHMYGPGFEYVVDAYNCLNKGKNRDMLLFLQMHMQTAVGFYSHLGKRTK